MSKILISASSLTTALGCMRMAAQKAFGARKNNNSALRDALKDNGHLNFAQFGKFSASAGVGTSCHKGAELLCREKASGLQPSLSAAKDAVIVELRMQDLEFDDKVRNLQTAENNALKMITVFERDLLPKIHPKTVENRLNLEVDEFVFTGQTDIVEMDGSVYDHKFGSSGVGGYVAQAGFNSLLVDIEGGKLRVGKIDTKTFESSLYEWEKPAGEMFASKLTNRIIKQIRDYMKTGDPESFDANPSHGLCGKKYCPAHGTSFCKWAR